MPMPTLAGDAGILWNKIPETDRKKILDAVWCSTCRKAVSMQLREGEVLGRSLILRGTCKTCAAEVARVLEPAED